MAGTFRVGGNVSGNVMVPTKIEPARARGYLKTRGSVDPDILAMARTDLLKETTQKRFYAWVFMVIGVLLAPTIIGLALTVVFVPMAIWGLSRAKHNERVVDEAIAQVIASGGNTGTAA